MHQKRRKSFRHGRLRIPFLPILVWPGALACVAMLFRYRVQRFEFVGLARGQSRQIAANITGRLKSLPVELLQQVARGQIVAVVDTLLDNENLQGSLATAKAEITRLTAELQATRDRLAVEKKDRETDLAAAHRRLNIDLETARLRTLELITTLEPDRIMLGDLQAEVDIEKDLLQRQVVATDYDLKRARARYDSLAMKVQTTSDELAQATDDMERARARLDEFNNRQIAHLSVDTAVEVIRQSINVQKKRIEELLATAELIKLTAPFDGVVSQIFRRPGETVLPGQAILTLSQEKPTEIIAYLGRDITHAVKQGKKVELIKNSRPPQIVPAQIAYVGPAVELMPERLWTNPNIPQWGRPFLVPVPQKTKPELKLIPGEMVGIRGL